jgi:FimV-like protein
MMSNGKNPLMLMMALTMPGASHALGLGDIHVDSALNEHLTAEIDIVGATALDLNDLRAAVANNETFLRYGVDRPPFLSSATFKVSQDSQGRPVLAVSSTESFTEPVVNLLVDLRWSHGEVVREYTLLLDPPGFAAAPGAPDLPAAPPAAMPIAETKTQTVARQSDPPTDDQSMQPRAERALRKTTHVKVGARATLRGIAWRVGERSEPDLQIMMLGIFRANPAAFDGNINRLHLGAVLTIPSQAELAAISKGEARREIHAQMAAWHSAAHAQSAGGALPAMNSSGMLPAAPSSALPVTAAPVAGSPPHDATGSSHGAVPATPAAAELGHQIHSMEQELAALKGVMDNQNDQMQQLQEQAARVDKSGSAVAALQIAVAPPPIVAAPQIAAAQHTVAAPQLSAPQLSAPQAVASMQPIAAQETIAAAQPIAAQHTVAAAQPVAAHTVVAAQPVAAPQKSAAPQANPKSEYKAQIPIAAGLGVLIAALAGLYFKFRRRTPEPKDFRGAGEVAAVNAPTGNSMMADAVAAQPMAPNAAAVRDIATREVTVDDMADALLSGMEDTTRLRLQAEDETHPLLPILPASEASGRSENAAFTVSRATAQDPTVRLQAQTGATPAEATMKLPVDTGNMRINATKLDYNLVDLDMTAHHVHMPSELNQQSSFKERRTNLVDVLKLAIEREPDRHDLRMKLLELYYSAAATNRSGFLDVVQRFADDRSCLQAEEWEKIASMGRQIASDNPLFAETAAADDDLADCA